MCDLTYGLRQLCRRNRYGSYATQADRQGVLTLAARQLREAGFRQMRATSLKGKHVEALLERWQAEGLSAGTFKNRLAHLRWWGRESRQGRRDSCRQRLARHPRVEGRIVTERADGSRPTICRHSSCTVVLRRAFYATDAVFLAF
jgi:hypothetical protein